MKQVYVLNDNINEVYKNKNSLIKAVKILFENECKGDIKEVLIGDLGSISIVYEIVYEETRFWNNYSYKKVNIL